MSVDHAVEVQHRHHIYHEPAVEGLEVKETCFDQGQGQGVEVRDRKIYISTKDTDRGLEVGDRGLRFRV